MVLLLNMVLLFNSVYWVHRVGNVCDRMENLMWRRGHTVREAEHPVSRSERTVCRTEHSVGSWGRGDDMGRLRCWL